MFELELRRALVQRNAKHRFCLIQFAAHTGPLRPLSCKEERDLAITGLGSARDPAPAGQFVAKLDLGSGGDGDPFTEVRAVPVFAV